MKNALNYYYNLNTEDIHQKKDTYYFEIDHQLFVLYPYLRQVEDLKYLSDLSNEMLKNGIYTHRIIPNKDQQLLTIINNHSYVLLMVYPGLDKKLQLEDVYYFSNMSNYIEYPSFLKREQWDILWANKIDYFEYQVNQFGNKFPIIRNSFSYFVGIAENGISLYNTLKKDDTKFVVGHYRMPEDATLFDLYNPLSFVVDLRVRDMAEYFKSLFLVKDDLITDIKSYISIGNLSEYELMMFYVRMFYPSFYFDLYERVLAKEKDEEELLVVIEKIPAYETLLRDLYVFLSRYVHLPQIEWLKKIT